MITITPPALDEDFDRGYRYVATGPQIGDELPASHSWDGDERGEELAGTCAFADLADCLEYAKHSSGWIVALDGVQVATGDLGGEVIIDEAIVIARWAI